MEIYLISLILFFVFCGTYLVLVSLMKILPPTERKKPIFTLIVQISNLKNKLIENNIALSGAIVILLFAVFFISLNLIGTPQDFEEGILVEMAGMLLDAVLLFFLFNLMQELREKRLTIKRYENEIDDFRGWKENEAKYRVMGNINRLSKMGINNIDLTNTYLNGSTFHNLNLTDSIFYEADMHSTRFEQVELQNTIFIDSYLKGAYFFNCDLENANFTGAIFYETTFEEVNLQNIIFTRTNLNNVAFHNLDISNIRAHRAYVSHDWFSKIEKMDITGIEKLKQKYSIIESTMRPGVYSLKLKP